MKNAMGFVSLSSVLCLTLSLHASAQDRPLPPDMIPRHVTMPFSAPPPSEAASRFRIPGKMVTQYTAEDWGTLIDSTWGPGQSATDQLHVFDTFWTLIGQQWGGFPNLAPSCSYWDSVRSVYRPQIGSGLSRGRFAALMSRMWMALSELHTGISDLKVDTVFGNSSWHYRRGVPLLVIGPVGDLGLRAAVTPLPDSTGLVYRVAPGNPLDLKPGDLIVGYDGVPWKHLYPQLLDAGLPVGLWPAWHGSTPVSMAHFSMMGVAFNWGMFDTIDVVKFSSDDTLHLPTALLDTVPPPQPVWPSDQVPVAGVPMPQAPRSAVAVSWGVVQGTNIGYIYVWDWWSAQTGQLFQDAVNDLLHTRGVEGLVLDFRMNWGGDYTVGNGGLSHLFNFDPTVNLRRAERNSTTDCMSFTLQDFPWGFPPGTLYDRPIAVLIGPGCFSAGDLYALRLRTHPMARFFGKPTNGAFVAGTYAQGTLPDAWRYYFPTGQLYSLVPGEGYLMHKGVQPDEEVWLTRDGVARGEDDVVKRALQWINNASYAHDIKMGKSYYSPGTDTVWVQAHVTNPKAHPLTVKAYYETVGTVADSSLLYDDGLHHDSAAADGVWGTAWRVPMGEAFYTAAVSTYDPVDTTRFTLQGLFPFTTAGPVVVDSIATKRTTAENVRVDLWLRNTGKDSTIRTIKATLQTADSLVKSIVLNNKIFGNLSPGQRSATGQTYVFKVDPNVESVEIPFTLEVSSNYVAYWKPEILVHIPPQTGVIASTSEIPAEYQLHQNYPNPFNPSTTIKYELPERSHVTLAVFNTLGQKVRTLADEVVDAGYHSAEFDASGLASGVYLYRLQAGDFVFVKNLVVLK